MEKRSILNRRVGCGGALVLLVLVAVPAWYFLGLFTVQPIGAVPEGRTLVRLRGERPFFDSADRLCLEKAGGVSLLCRGLTLAAVVRNEDRIVARLPYWEFAFEVSMEGVPRHAGPPTALPTPPARTPEEESEIQERARIQEAATRAAEEARRARGEH